MVQFNYHMKRFLIFGMVVSFSVAFNSRAAQTAQARIYCQSLRFQQGVYHGLAGDTTLDLSTINQNNLGDPAFPKNGELAPTFSDPDHFSGFGRAEKQFFHHRVPHDSRPPWTLTARDERGICSNAGSSWIAAMPKPRATAPDARPSVRM